MWTCQISAQEFDEVSEEVGIVGGFGETGFGGASFGSGISFADFNNDGWDDITIGTDEDSTIMFFQNNQGIFSRLPALVPSTCLIKQILWVDIDNDGDRDLYHTCYQDRNRVYENIGDLTFEDRTDISGFDTDADPSTAASFGDINQDGFLDLFVGNYGQPGQSGQENHFYLSNGDFTFTEYTVPSGFYLDNLPTLASSFLDIDHDLDLDMYLSIDKVHENHLYLNQGDSTFADISASSNSNVVVCAMNSSSGDYDGDGDLDIYVTNTPSGNVLLRNNGDLTFTDVTAAAGVGFFRIGWATSFIDYENDGDIDMYVSSTTTTGPNALYENNNDGTFSEPLFSSGGLDGDDFGLTYCNTHGDFNNDGLVDFALSNLAPFNNSAQQFKLWENENDDNDNNWLKVDLEGTISNRDGIGAWVQAYANNQRYVRFTHLGDGYLGQSSDYTHIGVSTATIIDSLVIEWPSGMVDKYYNLNVNQLMPIIEGTSSTVPNPCPMIRYFKEDEGIVMGDYSASIGIISKGYINNTYQCTYNVGEFADFYKDFEVLNTGTLEVNLVECTTGQ